MKRIFFFAFFILVFQNVQAENYGLSEAYEVELINRVKSVFSPPPPGMRTIEDRLKKPVCATSIFLEAAMVKHRLSPKARAMLDTLLSRPKYDPYPESTYDSPSGHFKIHYTISGPAAVYAADVDVNPADEVPDYVNRCAEFFDYVWRYEIETLGYGEPPSDYFYPDSNGGDGKYDVYLDSMEYLGYTVPEQTQNYPAYTSYIGMLNDFSDWFYLHDDPLDLPRVTAAHEFFHAIQMGYDATEYEYENGNGKPYWMEMSAVWMEDMAYDDVNDYIYYLPSFFNHPEWSLKTFGRGYGDVALHAYGSCVWPIYLSEKWGHDIIKDIWEKCAEKAGDNVIEATDAALRVEARGSNFEDAFREFTAWNYFTADRARTKTPGRFYSEGDQFYYPGVVPKKPIMVKVDSVLHYHTTYPVYPPSGPNHPHGLGSNYVVFKPEEKQGGIKLKFLPTTGEYQISAVGYNEHVYEPLVQRFQINHQTGYAETTDVYNWTSYNEIIMIPAVTSRNPDSFFVYTYSAEYDSSLHGENPLPQEDYIRQNFPNPFVINSSLDSTYFPFILSSVSEVEIDVFTISGELVWHYPPPEKEGKEWTIGNYTKRGGCPAWNGRNQEGEYVASGIYLYHVKTKNSSVIKKLAVIR